MADIEWTEVESSNIDAIGYDKETEELHVRFNTGGEYVYSNVPAWIAKEFLDAGSKGKYFHANIKSKYENGKV